MTIAILLIYGVVPNMDESVRIVIFFIIALVYCTVFLAIAMAMSTISKSSAMAVIYTIGLVFLILLFSIMSYTVSDAVAGMVAGPAPPQPQYSPYGPYVVNSYGSNTDPNSTVVYNNGGVVTYDSSNSNDTSNVIPPYTMSPAEEAYNNYSTKKSQVTMQISDILNTISPISDFSGFLSMGNSIALTVLSNQKPYDFTSSNWVYSNKPISVWQSLAYVWIKILALIVEIIVAFGVSYILFMRLDIR